MPERPQFDRDELQIRLRRAFEISNQAVTEGVTPGAILAVGNSSNTVLHATGVTTSLLGGAPTTPDTLYDLASLSKLFTAFMVLKLLEEGRLRLDDPAAFFLPEFEREDKREITIRHLLTHTSGLMAHNDYYKTSRSSVAMRQAIAEDDLEATIGSRVCYSCLGYIILAGVIEKVSGTSLDVYLKQSLLAPLGMVNTGYNPKQPRRWIAPTEDCAWRRDIAWGEVHDENAFAQGGISGNAGVFSSATEMVRFAQLWLGDGTWGKQRLLAPVTLQLSLRDYTGKLGGERRGLGWLLQSKEQSFMGDLAPKNAFGHTGFTGTSLVINPELGVFVLWLTNRVHPSRTETRHIRYRTLLHNAIWAALS